VVCMTQYLAPSWSGRSSRRQRAMNGDRISMYFRFEFFYARPRPFRATAGSGCTVMAKKVWLPCRKLNLCLRPF
jgi:hypothetical protein